MSRYGYAGPPILETPDVLGRYAVIVGDALREAQQQQAVDRWRQVQQRQNEMEFQYQRQQDQAAADQDRADAAAIAAAAAGEAPAMAGVSAGGAGRVVELQQRMAAARDEKFGRELDMLSPHVLNGSKLAMLNWDAVRSRQTGEDRTGEAQAFYEGKIEEYNRQKELERQAKIAEHELSMMFSAPERMARLNLAGLPTTGLDGTAGPPDPLSQALYNADTGTANQYMDDRRRAAGGSVFDPSAIGDLPGVSDAERQAIIASSTLKGAFDDEMYRALLNASGRDGARIYQLRAEQIKTRLRNIDSALEYAGVEEAAALERERASLLAAIDTITNQEIAALTGNRATGTPGNEPQTTPEQEAQALDQAMRELGPDADQDAVIDRALAILRGGT